MTLMNGLTKYQLSLIFASDTIVRGTGLKHQRGRFVRDSFVEISVRDSFVEIKLLIELFSLT